MNPHLFRLWLWWHFRTNARARRILRNKLRLLWLDVKLGYLRAKLARLKR